MPKRVPNRSHCQHNKIPNNLPPVEQGGIGRALHSDNSKHRDREHFEAHLQAWRHHENLRSNREKYSGFNLDIIYEVCINLKSERTDLEALVHYQSESIFHYEHSEIKVP